jgi:hypothetical protein
MQPSIGRIVHYTLTQQDAAEINRRRSDYQAFRSNFSGPSDPGQAGADGHIAHVGNHAAEGQVCAATIVRTFGGPAVNLQVHLDGNDTYWATSRTEGTEPGTWTWPERT